MTRSRSQGEVRPGSAKTTENEAIMDCYPIMAGLSGLRVGRWGKNRGLDSGKKCLYPSNQTGNVGLLHREMRPFFRIVDIECFPVENFRHLCIDQQNDFPLLIPCRSLFVLGRILKSSWAFLNSAEICMKFDVRFEKNSGNSLRDRKFKKKGSQETHPPTKSRTNVFPDGQRR